jgi:ketosteroid isomerase-like protein
MTESDLQLVRRLFGAFETGDIEAVIDLFSDDFVLVVPPSMSAEPDTFRVTDGEVTAIESHPDLAAAREALTRRR